MIKSFLIITSFSILLFSSQQIVLVVSDNFNSSIAKLECYEGSTKVCSDIEVNLGKNGLAWGLGEVKLLRKKNEPLKYEGDKKAPAGIFKLTNIFGYDKNSNFNMPYLYASKNLICVDDSKSNFYNQIIEMNGDEKSFEYMKRNDQQYKVGIVVAHNKNAKEKRGSCIFLHIQKEKNHPTLGCTSMKFDDLKKIANWLDINKNPILIQISKSSSTEILQLYPELKSSKLLKTTPEQVLGSTK
jgi:hypothetical protein